MAVITIIQAMLDAWNTNKVKLYCNDVLVDLSTQINVGDTVTFKCDDGYQFDQSGTAQPRYVRRRAAGTNSSGQFETINHENTIASHVINLPSGVTSYVNFSATTVAYTPPQPKFVCMTVTQAILDKLVNVKLLVNNAEVVLGQELYVGDKLTLQANSNYYLAGSPHLVSDEDYQLDIYFSMGGESKPTQGTLTLIYDNTYNDISFMASPITVQLFTIDQNILDYVESKNINMLCNGTYIYAGRVLVQGDALNIKPKQNFELVLSGCYFLNENNSQINFDGTPQNANLTLTGADPLSNLVLETKSIYTPETIRLTVDSDMQNTLQANNASMFINNVPVSIGSTAINGDVIRIKANTGYELADRPSMWRYYDGTGYSGTVYFTLLNDNINAELTVDMYGGSYLTNLELLTTQVDIVAGANNLYKITKADLKQINIDRFATVGTSPPTTIDYGTNILGVINLPFNINPDLVQAPELVKLGRHETTVTAPKIVTDKLYLDLGNINVPLPDNSLGFTNTRAIIHLPYANSLDLNISEVLGQIINVEYVIDLYNGNSYVNIKSDKSNSIIATSNVDLGVAIPYSSMNGNNNTVYNDNMQLGGDNHVKTPYIEIIQNIPILGNGFFTAPITAEATLANEQGFIQVNEIKLNVSATSDEKDMILLALKNGVIIQ